jgi:hypothetical protein
MTDATEALSPPSEEPAKGGLDAILESALDGYDEEPKAEEAAPVDDKPVSDDRPRDAHGRFIPKDTADAKPSEPEPAAAEATPAEPVTTEPPAVEPIQPHARWDEALKTQFATWPRDVQQAFLDRHNAFEGDYTRKTQELAEMRKGFEPLQQEVGKWTNYLSQLGVRPEQAFSQMLTTEFTLRTGTPEQKQQALAYLAQLYGVNIPTSQEGDSPAPRAAFDPTVTQLHQTVAGLQSQLRQISEQKQHEEYQRAQAEFNAFGQTKDANGQPKYPHFDRVKDAVIRLVADGQAESWETAYSKAVRLDDDLHKQIIEAERVKALEAAEKARQEAVEKARRAQPVRSSDGAPKGGTSLKGLDAHLGAALDRAGLN